MKDVACSHCHGKGTVTVFDGVAVLAERYPTLPVAEMFARGWISGSGKNGPDTWTAEDEKALDASFLRFWGAKSHDEIPAIMSRPFPGVACFGDEA